jgi:hypothetical protein
MNRVNPSFSMRKWATNLDHLIFHSGIACPCFEGEAQAKSITPGNGSKFVEKIDGDLRTLKIAIIIFLETINVEFPCTMAAGMLFQQVVFSYAGKP